MDFGPDPRDELLRDLSDRSAVEEILGTFRHLAGTWSEVKSLQKSSFTIHTAMKRSENETRYYGLGPNKSWLGLSTSQSNVKFFQN
jgi:hypothetical protein